MTMTNGKLQIANHCCPVKLFRTPCNFLIMRKKRAKMSFYDLKCFPGFSGLGPVRISLEEGCREPRTNHIRSNHEVSFSRRVRSMRSALRWEPIHQALLLLGSVSGHGLRPTDLSREPSRHRSLSGNTAQQALSLWAQRTSEAILACRCQRTSRLENLCRFRAHAHRHCAPAVRRHRPRVGPGRNALRAGRHDYRSVSFDVPLGKIQKGQGCNQASHNDRDSQLYPSVYRYNSRQSSRREGARHPHTRARLIPGNGSRLSRFCSSLCPQSGASFLRHPSQKQSSIPASVLSFRGQVQRPEKRPDWHLDWAANLHFVSRSIAARDLLFSRDSQVLCLSDQQFFSSSTDRRQSISLSLANRTLFQMDQTASTNQTFLWHLSEQREDSNLDWSLSLHANSDHQKAAWLEAQPLYTILQILSLSLFEKKPILSLFEDYDEQLETFDSSNQLNLWEI